MYLITGTCNDCGQCCGAPGSPNQDSPWPDTWPEGLRNWSQAGLDQINLLKHIQLPTHGGDPYWTVRLGNVNYHGIWVPGHGLCKDSPPYGDILTFEETCPFLMDQEVDDSYPCALDGNPIFDEVYQTCRHEIAGKRVEEHWKMEWETNHPLCSYVLEYVPE